MSFSLWKDKINNNNKTHKSSINQKVRQTGINIYTAPTHLKSSNMIITS